MGYIYKVPFDKKRQRKSDGDCVIRAIAFACTINQSWNMALSMLFEKALRVQDGPQNKRVFKAVLEDNHYKWVSVKEHGRYPTVREFTNSLLLIPNDYEYVLSCRHHLVYGRCGDYWDVFDSGDLKVLGCWVRSLD